MNSIKFNLLPAQEYYEELLHRIPEAKNRIVIHSMIVNWQPMTERLVPTLINALNSGVTVDIVGDAFTWFGIKNRAKWPHTSSINRKLMGYGADVTYVGKLWVNPFAGRCHSKITLVDDDVYSFGGVNFSDTQFGMHDFMLHCHDSKIADQLFGIVKEIALEKPMLNIQKPLDSQTELLFDSGKKRDSIIYKTACQMVAQAKKVYLVSQYPPSGELATLLRRTNSQCYFDRPEQAAFPDNASIVFDTIKGRLHNLYRGETYIHAKFILCENADGSKHLVTSSNNFSWRGVAFGTKEIAIYSSDEKLWQALYDFLQERVIGAAK